MPRKARTAQPTQIPSNIKLPYGQGTQDAQALQVAPMAGADSGMIGAPPAAPQAAATAPPTGAQPTPAGQPNVALAPPPAQDFNQVLQAAQNMPPSPNLLTGVAPNLSKHSMTGVDQGPGPGSEALRWPSMVPAVQAQQQQQVINMLAAAIGGDARLQQLGASLAKRI